MTFWVKSQLYLKLDAKFLPNWALRKMYDWWNPIFTFVARSGAARAMLNCKYCKNFRIKLSELSQVELMMHLPLTWSRVSPGQRLPTKLGLKHRCSFNQLIALYLNTCQTSPQKALKQPHELKRYWVWFSCPLMRSNDGRKALIFFRDIDT